MEELIDHKVYTANDVAKILKLSSNSSLNAVCREGLVEGACKSGQRLWMAGGSSWKKWRESTGTRTFSIQKRLSNMQIRQYDENNGKLILSNVKGCVTTGIKPVLKITSGTFSTVATKDHLFLTSAGWKKLGDITLNDSLITYKYGTGASEDRFKKIDGRWVATWCRQNRDEVALRQNNKCKLTGEELEESFHIHHLKPRHERPDLAFDIKNVVAVNSEAHDQYHTKQGWQVGKILTTQESPVTNIEDAGEIDTYDLEIEGEFPNFFADGIVVHNSRNASSSRAIPIKKAIEAVRSDLAIPIHWGLNQPGMQSFTEADEELQAKGEALWRAAGESACRFAENMAALGFHKQICNRLTEPFQHINVVISSTQMSNFYALRRHPDAQPEIKALADAMWEAQEASTPQLLKLGQWHLPYIQPHEWCDYNDEASGTEILKQVSAARCARVSYMTFDGKPSILENDVALCEKLVGMIPLHASPFEHQATPDEHVHKFKGLLGWAKVGWVNPHLHGNFTGWCQNRKFMDGECQ